MHTDASISLFRSSSLHPTIVSNAANNSIHRFFDTSPLSPSGRYVAVTSTPSFHRSSARTHEYKTRYAVASIELTDITTGARQLVAETLAWDSQLGAQLQWGASDNELYYNTLEPVANLSNIETPSSPSYNSSCPTSCATQTNGYWTIRGVQQNPVTSVIRQLECPIYHVSSDGQYGIAPNLLKMHHTQKGYGVRLLYGNSIANANSKAPLDDGLYLTDIASGSCSLHATLYQLATAAGIDIGSTPMYGFHTKFSSDGALIMFIVRTLETPAPPRTAPVRVQHLFVLPRAPHRDSPPRRVISWASYPFIPRMCPEKNSRGICDVVNLRDGNHPNWVPGTHKISMNLDASTTPQWPESTVSKLLKGAAGLVDALQVVTDRAMGKTHQRASSSQRQGKWCIVTIDVDAHAPGCMYHYDTRIHFSSADRNAAVTQPAQPAQTRITADMVANAGSPDSPSSALHIRIDHGVGTGHPIYHPSGEYIITDAYPKETHLLPRDPTGRLTLLPGEVPLRLIQVSTQREVWLLKMQVERRSTRNASASAAPWMVWARGASAQVAALLIPASSAQAPAGRASSAHTGDELDGTSYTAANVAHAPPSQPSDHAAQHSPLHLPPHTAVMTEDKSWRCDLHPAWSRDFQYVTINGRPTGGERQVLLVHVGANLSMYFD